MKKVNNLVDSPTQKASNLSKNKEVVAPQNLSIAPAMAAINKSTRGDAIILLRDSESI